MTRGPAPRERRPDLGRQRVGHREKHGVGFVGEAIDIEALDRRVPDPLQRRDPLAPRERARAHRQADVGMRVLGQPPQQFDAGIARCPGDADPDSRITIHPNH